MEIWEDALRAIAEGHIRPVSLARIAVEAEELLADAWALSQGNNMR